MAETEGSHPQPTNAVAYGPKVTQGRIVRWVTPDCRRTYPAVVTTPHTRNIVNLTVFDESGIVHEETSVEFDARALEGPGGTWHWPPRE